MKLAWLSIFCLATNLLAAETLRPPAVPLVACDPYFSVWSPADNLNDADTVHWTGKPHRLSSFVKIDGQSFRVMGAEPKGMPALKQTRLSVWPTRTIYEFEGAGVVLTLTFMTPALPDDLEVLSWPVTYVTYEVRATDRKTHHVIIYFDASGELTVNEPGQQVVWKNEQAGDLNLLKVGSEDQSVLQKKGDDIRIDWGYLYLAAPSCSPEPWMNTFDRQRQQTFFATGGSGLGGSTLMPANADTVSASLEYQLHQVGTKPTSRWFMLAYDDLYSIRYMRKNLRPYWRRNGWEASDLLKAAAKQYESLAKRCAAFDKELMADLTKTGGEKYAAICALAYRQCFAAGKFVADANGQPISFCKENHSNGCIGTSDVFYPMAPQFLLFGPTLAKSFLVPFMNYAASERWKFLFAPHDLGQYPHANGQRYGGGERTEENQMPVEESGNMILLVAAIANAVDDDDLMAVARSAAARIGSLPLDPVRTTKRLLLAGRAEAVDLTIYDQSFSVQRKLVSGYEVDIEICDLIHTDRIRCDLSEIYGKAEC